MLECRATPLVLWMSLYIGTWYDCMAAVRSDATLGGDRSDPEASSNGRGVYLRI